MKLRSRPKPRARLNSRELKPYIPLVMDATHAAPLNSYCIITYGCQMNDHDSEIMAGILDARGMHPVKDESLADVVIVNTCVVRGGAEERALGRIGQMAGLKKRRPGMIIAVAGCMAQKDAGQLIARMPHLDMVIGTRDLYKLSSLIDEFNRTGESLVSIKDVDKPVFLDAFPVRRKHKIKALTTIMYGCGNLCSYCVVPQTRGREVSRPMSEIADEVRRLGDDGYKEVLLIGQNVNSYCHEGRDFADLLEALNGISGIERIRFITSHPKDCSDKLIEAVASLDKVCENFHLPAQSGSDSVLERMNRRYSAGHYLGLVEKIRQRMPGAAVTTDLIVGFPGETEADYEQTCELLERSRWDSAFIFMYSPRAGTPAAQWPDSVPLAEKKRRLQRCLARQEEISGGINRALAGQKLEALVESVSRRSARQLIGRARGGKCVIFDGDAGLIGKLVQVKITGSVPHTLFGSIDEA
ncbi:MAG: tRNA (N6-isopentenyl adenosine(37)-C2)-methylthiotransferase MiaB [Candidatus Sumerlaeota bacterium]|nr:tRNA (N6-isopentenyl adenosine(37)-C2)-methylthiotransferase MiaB [Candidatus Sumerlaeota bacterium]